MGLAPPPTMIRMGQLNTRHCELAWTLLEQSTKTMELDVLFIQEPPPSVLRARRGWMGYKALLPMVASPLVAVMVKETIVVESMELF